MSGEGALGQTTDCLWLVGTAVEVVRETGVESVLFRDLPSSGMGKLEIINQ